MIVAWSIQYQVHQTYRVINIFTQQSILPCLATFSGQCIMKSCINLETDPHSLAPNSIRWKPPRPVGIRFTRGTYQFRIIAFQYAGANIKLRYCGILEGKCMNFRKCCLGKIFILVPIILCCWTYTLGQPFNPHWTFPESLAISLRIRSDWPINLGVAKDQGWTIHLTKDESGWPDATITIMSSNTCSFPDPLDFNTIAFTIKQLCLINL